MTASEEWGSGDEPSPQQAAALPGTPAEVDSGLVAQVQALLFISEEGLSDERLAAAVERTVEATRAALSVLAAHLEEPWSGITLREHASGWRLTTAPACAPVLERFVIDGHSSRLSPAALETLAVVAYQQPVSRGRIAAIRGVAVDGVIRTLVARGLVEEVGAESSGALLYATTSLFMDKLGVKSLTELPELAPLLPDIETLDGFDDRPPPAAAPTVEVGGEGHAVGPATGVVPDRPGSEPTPSVKHDRPAVERAASTHESAHHDQGAESSQRGEQPDPNGDADADQ